MTNQELEEMMKRLAQVQVEALQLIGSATDRHDRAVEQHDRAIEQHDREMGELRLSLARLSDAQLTTQAGLDALIATVDRYLRGGANGQH